ncbi:MAG: DUF2267 domain-containing protein [Bauldia sp.]|nr:DUF2267 domain-containing protein [Bauldia sp.]
MTQPYDVEFASQQYQEWLAALKETASLVTHNQSQAMMRAVMHRLRRSLAPDDVLAVANALPALPRGIFLDGWSLDEERFTPASAKAFTAAVADDLKAHHVPPDTIVADVFAVWSRHLDGRKAAIVAARLPDVLKPLWPAGSD